MRFTLLFLLAVLFFPNFSPAQNAERFSRVEVLLGGRAMGELAQLGIEVDHGLVRPGYSFVADLGAAELAAVRAAGFEARVLIDDVGAFYTERLKAGPAVPARSGEGCGSALPNYPTPANYTYGSMGGYQTYVEILAVLDSMHARFPNLITLRDTVSGTLTTHEGRPLWYVKVSDNPVAEEAEPKVLYTALHHAREPVGMTQMLFFLWYLLENYETDARVQYIVDHNQLYFVPCLNPDGYIYNEITNPDGGGMWRKNRRLNDDGTYGVDLNRNYDFEWGINDLGSSPIPNAATYRGPVGFSEPETRMVRDFALEHEFLFALNYHTWSNLLIYPWAYNDVLADPAFRSMAEVMTRENHYVYGTSIETVGYAVNGSSDDWMYGITGTYAMTPEVGLTGFWPTFDEIDPLNKLNVWPNLFLALSAGRYGEVRDRGSDFITTYSATWPFQVTRYGLEGGPLTVSFEPISANFVSVTGAQVFNLARFDTVAATFDLVLAPWVTDGDTVRFAYAIDNGSFVQRDTVTKIFGGNALPVFSDNGTDLAAWSGEWSTTTESFVSAPSSITDSPFSFYEPGTFTAMTLATPLFVPADAESVRLRFFARWDIEEDFDYAQVVAIPTNGAPTPLCGKYTETGIEFQAFDQPVYDGRNLDWVEENMDLSAFAGQEITLSFLLVSDGAEERNGFFFDDLSIEYLQTTGATVIPLEQFRLSNQPNPAVAATVVRWQNAAGLGGPAELLVSNNLGQMVHRQPVDLQDATQIALDTRSWAPGVYTYVLRTAQGRTMPAKMTIVK